MLPYINPYAKNKSKFILDTSYFFSLSFFNNTFCFFKGEDTHTKLPIFFPKSLGPWLVSFIFGQLETFQMRIRQQKKSKLNIDFYFKNWCRYVDSVVTLVTWYTKISLIFFSDIQKLSPILSSFKRLIGKCKFFY